MTFAHNTIIACSQIFLSRTNYILGTYVTKMAVISSPQKYCLITLTKVILRYSWKYFGQANYSPQQKLKLNKSYMVHLEWNVSYFMFILSSIKFQDWLYHKWLYPVKSFRLTFPVEVSPLSLSVLLCPDPYRSIGVVESDGVLGPN